MAIPLQSGDALRVVDEQNDLLSDGARAERNMQGFGAQPVTIVDFGP